MPICVPLNIACARWDRLPAQPFVLGWLDDLDCPKIILGDESFLVIFGFEQCRRNEAVKHSKGQGRAKLLSVGLVNNQYKLSSSRWTNVRRGMLRGRSLLRLLRARAYVFVCVVGLSQHSCAPLLMFRPLQVNKRNSV